MKTPDEVIKMVNYRIDSLKYSPSSFGLKYEEHIEKLRDNAIQSIKEYKAVKREYFNSLTERERLEKWLENLKEC